MKLALSKALGRPLTPEQIKSVEEMKSAALEKAFERRQWQVQRRKEKRHMKTARYKAEQCWVCRDLFGIVKGSQASGSMYAVAYTWSYFHCAYNPRAWHKQKLRETHDYLVKRGPEK